MDKVIKFLKIHPLLASCLIYLYLASVFIPMYQYQINPDAISYIGLAEKLINLEFKNFVNGVWGPLYPILLSPFLALNIPPFLSARLLGIILGTATLVAEYKIATRLTKNRMSIFLVLAASVILILHYSISLVTPDLLLLLLLLTYLYFVSKPGRRYLFFAPAVAALAYFAKSYALPFFLVHFALTNLVLGFKFRGKIQDTALRIFLGYIIFFAIVGPWIYLLSQKYGHLTFTTAFSHNLALQGPNAQVINEKHLIPPPNPTATSILEDVTYLPNYIPLENWSPFSSFALFKHQIKTIMVNTYHLLLLVAKNFPLIFLILALMVVSFLKNPKKTPQNIILATIFLYPLGYLIFHIEERYLWPSIILIVISQVKLFEAKKINYFVAVVFLAGFAISPAKNLLTYKNLGQEIYIESKTLREEYPTMGKRFASNDQRVASTFIVYYLKGQYWGLSENPQELLESKIDYYFSWGEKVPFFRYQKVIYTGLPNLKIYRLNRN